MHPRARALRTKTLALVSSLVIAVIGAEGVMRLLYERFDFLKPEFISDEVLPDRVAPFSAGHDAWGFRNRALPDRADIVAIGDSTTYGDSAPAAGSWPSWLARTTGMTVYN